ncbi:hypothetical protein [Paenibacillus ginsengarvi]|uniref:hypothetical protein n=1 Tax=Paenibacillus ginsengarvi TaxID=400777 RepID=UPI001876D635|nr:hypothetical protein [Paenibacillus ginsengarvi]
MTLTLGMLPLLGLLGAKEASAFEQPTINCSSVANQVYISVYSNTAPNPKCYNTSTVLLDGVGNYIVTLHITEDYNPESTVMSKVQNGVSQEIEPITRTGSQIVFEVEGFLGAELHFAVLPYWMNTPGIYYKEKNSFTFWDTRLYQWIYPTTPPSQFDIYLSQMQEYSAARIVGSTGTLLGEANLVNGRAFIPNISIEQGNRIYGLLLNNNLIEDSFFVGYRPPGMEYSSVYKTVAKGFDPTANLYYHTNVDSLNGYPDEDSVTEQPANQVLYYYAKYGENPILRLQNGNDVRFITITEEETIFSPSDLYTVTLTKTLPESNVQLNGQIVYSKEHIEGNYYIDTPHLSDSLGRVTFVHFMPNKVSTIPNYFYYENEMGLPFTLVPTSVVDPVQGGEANLSVVSVTRPGSPDPSKFDLADLVWFAKNAYRFDIDQNGVHDGNDLTDLMHLLAPGY